MEKIRHDKRFWLALTIFSLTGQVAWTVENMYFNVFIYKMFHASASSISVMVAASAVAATVTTLIHLRRLHCLGHHHLVLLPAAHGCAECVVPRGNTPVAHCHQPYHPDGLRHDLFWLLRQ